MASLVYLQHKNGKIYVYENISFWDKKTHKAKSKRKCIGHLDTATKKIVPNRKKETTVLTTSNSPECYSYDCGIALLLDKITNDMKLNLILKKIFPDDWKAILTCTYFLISEGQALSRVEKWSKQSINPYGGMLADQRVSELLSRITESNIQNFFTKWFEANSSDEYYCMDITSVSSYSEFNEFVSFGYNRDGEDLPQINLLLISGHQTHLPLFYRIIPGSIKDVSTLNESLQRLNFIDIKHLHMVMDKGFYSESNVDAMYDNHVRFSIGVPFTSSIARDAVERHRTDDMTTFVNYINVLGDEVFAVSELYKWKNHRCYLHIYFDNIKAAIDERKFSHKILTEYEELVSGKTHKAHENDYKRFFTVKETPKRGRKVNYNQEEINKYRKNTVGWFVMATNDIKDSKEALEIYRMKDAVEKHFDDLKNDLDMKRLRIHSSSAMEGRIFIQFISLIISSQIKTVMNENDWFNNHNMQEVIDELKSIRVMTFAGKKKKIYTTLTSFQKEILKLFDIVF